MKISSRFEHHKVDSVKIESRSMTHQSFKDECDVNNIVEGFRTAVSVGDPSSARQPMFGDFTNVPDYHEAQNVITEANELFLSLPAHVRERFDHNPGEFLDFCSDPANRSELSDLGLLRGDYSDDIVDDFAGEKDGDFPGGQEDGNSPDKDAEKPGNAGVSE